MMDKCTDLIEVLEATVGEHGYVALTGHGRWLHRTPLMAVCNDDAGTQQFCLDLAIDSLSEPPEGDMKVEQCRAMWPDKTILANINVGLYARR